MNDNPEPYTDDELAGLPSTTTVFEVPKINLNDHQLIQEGYKVRDVCPSHPETAFNIPNGQMLIKDEKGYRLVDEITRT